MIRASWNQEMPELRDDSTGETVLPLGRAMHYEDFLVGRGSYTPTGVGGGGGQILAVSGGVMQCALTDTDTLQVGRVDANNHLGIGLANVPVFESRVRFPVLPSDAAVNAEIGMSSAYNDDPDVVATSVWFRLDGSGAVTVETDDGTHEQSKVATGVTLAVDEWAVLRIDCTDLAGVKFYINGVQVATATTFDMSSGTDALLQPVGRIQKASGTGVGTLDVDYFKIWQGRAS